MSQSLPLLCTANCCAMPCCAVQLYDNDPDKIDVMVGLLSEPPLPGFIFGESIYTVFLLQVGRQQHYAEHMPYTRQRNAAGMTTWTSCALAVHAPLCCHAA
jgi:hypothetical protein